ncbi:6-pyruvoyl-tetrahydropterin synthase-related protein [Caldilinea sp.]|jgi:hypothetical protein|uniref:6-pyruvoyl-tetrahydropterin synthase-related protein n=1 Tax=Caldilinea sp. TaxID=2293560 RepID=UPI001B17DEE4|nr:6-pyruvoyl-tetrahydropterin synthase-related protein [Caldilinea sp.]MBO9391353.1 hypothetical protein [Caldilinea sp.]
MSNKGFRNDIAPAGATDSRHLPSPNEPNSHPPLWRDALFWLAIGLTIFAVAPFLLPGYFWGANDARHHVYFLFEYDRLVQDGIWWPRWSPDFAFGYGYPFFNIYGPFSHFLGELFHHFLGFDFTDAVEAVFILSIVASAAAMYAFVRSWLGRPAALLAALAYTYAPYHLLNLYVRANLAESMAFVWLPLCLWTARQAVIRPAYRWVLGLAVSYAGLMVTSNLVIVLFTPLLAGYVLLLTLVHGERRQAGQQGKVHAWLKKVIPPALGGLAGLGLSAVFWLPAFAERQYVRVDQWFDGRYAYRGHFVEWHQLFSPAWGFGASVPGPDDTISFQIGAALIVFSVLGVLFTWKTLVRGRWEVLFFIVGALTAVFVASVSAAWLWELPIVGSVLQAAQFPWRWLVITTLCASLLTALIGHWSVVTETQRLSLPLLTLASLLILSSYPYLRVEIREPAEGPVSLAALMRFQQSADEMTGSTAWVKEIPTWSPMADYYISQEQAGGPVQPVDTKLDYSIFDYETFGASSVAHSTISEEVFYYNGRETPQRLVFNHFYYPGWNAYLLDGEHGRRIQQLPVIPEETGTLGRMTVEVPPGSGYLLLIYEDTPPRTIGGALTIATIAALGVGSIWITVRGHRRRRRIE